MLPSGSSRGLKIVTSNPRGDRLLKRVAGAVGLDVGQVSDRYRSAADVFVEEMVVVVEDAVSDERDIAVPDQRPEPVDVSEDTGATPRCHGQVQGGNLTVRFLARMLEVGMAVGESKAIPAPPPEGEERSEHDAAVPAQDGRYLPPDARGPNTTRHMDADCHGHGCGLTYPSYPDR